MKNVFRSVTVPDELAGRRFDQVAAQLLPEFSRSRLKAWIERGWLTVGGATAEPKSRVVAGAQLDLSAQLELQTRVDPEPIALRLVAEDESFWVVDKPAGLVVHPGAGNQRGTLQNALLHLDPQLAAVPRAGIVHRLDKDTSGLLVVARTLQAQQHLAAQIQDRRVRRNYQAICHGVLTGGATIDEPIGRHARERVKMTVRRDGRPARTDFTVLQRFRAHTHIELTLHTGRTHQIRVHMAFLRAPLVGDPLYGGRPRLPTEPTPRIIAALRACGRQMLHATALSFDHPAAERTVSFTSDLPSDFCALLDALTADTEARR